MTDISGWPWRPDLCPADLHYGEYLLNAWPALPLEPKVIHVGTGLHHHIGLLLGSYGWHVLGVTVSEVEVAAYHALTNRPRDYGCFVWDIRRPNYELEPEWRPATSMSLFHLGEPPGPAEGMLSEREVIERALVWSREVVFYNRSSAWDRIAPLIGDLVGEGKMEHVANYKSLEAYRPI